MILHLHVISTLIKNLHKTLHNYSFLSHDKTISFLLLLNENVLSISEYVLEKHELLSILMKILH